MYDFKCMPLEVPAPGLRLVGELDVATVDTLRESLQSLDGNQPVTLDLAELTFIDSCGIQAIVEYARSLGRDSVRIANASPVVLRMLELANVNEHPSLVVERRHGVG